MQKLTKIVILQVIVIIVLLGVIGICAFNWGPFNRDNGKLISPRIQAGILQPKSLLIFNFKPLEQEIDNYLEANNLSVALYVLNIRDGASFGINEDAHFGAFSLNKLPAAIIILKKVESGELTLDSELVITPEDRNSASGTLYKKTFGRLSVRELLRYMLQESDNTAFNVLAREISLEDGKNLTEYLDYYQNDIDEGSSPINLEITPKNTANLFMSLYLSTFLEPENSEMILQYLTNTSYDIKKHAGLPEEVIVAQKYGSFYYNNSQFFHSCGIMYIQDSRIFYCAMSENLERAGAEETVGEIVNKIYTYVQNNRANRF